jgi:WD40 repeat protein
MKRMLVGFCGASSAVVEMAVDSEALLLLSEGNTGRDLFMLANPVDPNQFVTGSATGILKLWNRASTGNKVVQRHVLDEAITYLRWNHDGSALVVTTIPAAEADNTAKPTGSVLFVSTADNKMTVVNRLGLNNSGPLTALSFSQDGQTLAVASSCATIYIYDREEPGKYNPVGRVFLPSIQHGIDFSTDGRFLRTFSQVEYLTDPKGQDLPASAPAEIHFIDLQAAGQAEGVVGRELTSEEMLKMMMNSTPWCTTSSCFTPELKGLVDAANEEGAIITSLSLSSDSRMVATGYNNGAVRVHKYVSLCRCLSEPFVDCLFTFFTFLFFYCYVGTPVLTLLIPLLTV